VTYDDLYELDPHYFGREPSMGLRDYYHLIDKSLPVLDIGSGTGRNSMFLARHGIRVNAIDPSMVAIHKLHEYASEHSLSIKAEALGFADLRASNGSFSAVMIYGLIQILDWDQIRLLLRKVDDWLSEAGIVFITAWTTEDPSFWAFMQNECVGKNSYRNDTGAVRTYLEKDEIVDLFPGYQVIYHWEGMGPKHSHGDKPPERHGTAVGVMRKR
jgi:2-polyprenyl-3-methyl-5-hydroxy-6-metoxy-1,4-benzoquinol methylase